jgi:hypothetical protein
MVHYQVFLETGTFNLSDVREQKVMLSWAFLKELVMIPGWSVSF